MTLSSDSKTVHFDLPPANAAEELHQKPTRPRRRKHRSQPPIPRRVFGLILTEESIRNIGLKVLPQAFLDQFTGDLDDFLTHVGQHFSNAHCQQHFPYMGLRWRDTVLVDTDESSGWRDLCDALADAGVEGVFGIGRPRARLVHCSVHRLGQDPARRDGLSR